MSVTAADHGDSTGALYRPLVRALFRDTSTMVLGVLASVFAIVLTAMHANSPGLYVCASVMALIGAGTALVNLKYRPAAAAERLDNAALYRWEIRYTIGAVATTVCLGWWCFHSLALLDDSFAALTSCIVTFANLIGVTGRNYPISRLMNLQIVTAGAGVLLGVAGQGTYHLALSVLIFVFIISMRQFGNAQRSIMFSELLERRKAEKLATQFTTALDNVPEAVFMFSPARKLEVANTQALHEIGIEPGSEVQMPLERMLKIFVDDLDISESDTATISSILYSDKHGANLTFKMRGDRERTIKLRANPMSNGGIVATFEDVTREVEAVSTIENLSRFDQLTGLINREELQRVLITELDHRSDRQQCAVILINLDRFKQWNDSLGHSVGDFLLCEATRRIKEVVGETGYCSRYGGDEFAVAVRNTNCLDLTKVMADQIIGELNRPVIIGKTTVQLSCSIGISVGGKTRDTAEALLKQADMALFWAKQDGRGEWRVFSQKMSHELEERRKLEEDLRNALKDGQFETHFQPLVSVDEKQITTCEALLRWHHPKNGPVSPAIFIPLAEEIGVIEDIGAWVLRDACETCATWPNGTKVAVNLSAVQFRQGDIVQTVKQILNETGLDPRRLELEITESLMLSDMKQTVARLNEFIAMGVRISLDDFGTGYSSLSYMHELPLHKVKIDRSFVQDIKEGSKSLTLVQAICALAQELELSVVVEGVEEAGQLEALLRHAKITEIQGYYFSRPLDQDQITEMLDRGSTTNHRTLKKLPLVRSIAA